MQGLRIQLQEFPTGLSNQAHHGKIIRLSIAPPLAIWGETVKLLRLKLKGRFFGALRTFKTLRPNGDWYKNQGRSKATTGYNFCNPLRYKNLQKIDQIFFE